jgi:hypothetical protein
LKAEAVVLDANKIIPAIIFILAIISWRDIFEIQEISK